MGFFEKIKNGIKRTKENIISKIDLALKSFKKIDEELFEEIEETLVLSDVGAEMSGKICQMLKKKVKEKGAEDPAEIRAILKEVVKELLDEDTSFKLSHKLSIILVVGVNGVGKTTTIGKLAWNLTSQGRKVILAAADTFRAAAIDQLQIWAKKSKSDIVKHLEGSDPAAVVFDAISAAKSRRADVVICDTAGRLHNKKNLMLELEKISRVIDSEAPDSEKEVLLILDATTGQNAINQAVEFKKVANVTGIVLTKLDGTAKGGIILGIKDKLSIPVKFIGVGEGIDDLQPFDRDEFTQVLFD